MNQCRTVSPLRIGALLIMMTACSGSQHDATNAQAAGGPGGGASGEGNASGGNASGGNASGGTAAGGNASGGTAAGGNASGGTAAGGNASGGKAVGGNASGGKAVGGNASGGKAAGGNASGGKAAGGNASGGKAAGGNASGGKAVGGNASGGMAAGGDVGGGTGVGGVAVNGGSPQTGGVSSGGAAGAAAIQLPTPNASFDYQIGGAYTPPSGVQVVSRDRKSAIAQGVYNICYVNGFQIQPEEEAFWTAQHPNLVLRDASGSPVVDQDWGETLLDTSTATKRTELASVIGGWVAQCKADGFNAVEIDNLDSYSRSNGLLTQANNVAFMALLSTAAHANGLAIAQKNSSELLGSVAAMGTDFAVVEECNRYDECGAYQTVYGNRLFIIEYRAQDFQKGCSAYPEISIVLRDRNVSTPGNSAYVYQGC